MEMERPLRTRLWAAGAGGGAEAVKKTLKQGRPGALHDASASIPSPEPQPGLTGRGGGWFPFRNEEPESQTEERLPRYNTTKPQSQDLNPGPAKQLSQIHGGD